MDFHSLTRRELQALCKKNGIPANITNVAMADSLKALLTTVQGTEDISNCSQSLTAQSGVESPERSEISSPRVPRTRSVRKNVGNETVDNQTQSRARRTTRKLNSVSAADEKDTIAPINIDVQFSEVQQQSKKISTSKEAGIPQTPSMVSNTRKRVPKGETTAKTYGTRRSTRLAAKMQEDSSDAANTKLFSADGGDNDEMSVKECNPDLSEDVQSTVSHSEVVSETSKSDEMTSYYSGAEIKTNPGSGYDSTKDCEENVEMVIAEVPEEEYKGDDFHEQADIEKNDEVIGENGFYEEPEVEMKDVVTAENGDVVTKQPDTEVIAEVAAESSYLNGESDVLNGNGEVVVTEEVMKCLTDNDDETKLPAETKDHDAENLIPDLKGLTLADNGDMIVEAEEHVAGGALLVQASMSESVEEEADTVTVAAEEQLDNGDCDALGVEEFVSKSEPGKEADVVTIAADEHPDSGDCDSLVGEESEFESEFDSESEDEDLVKKKHAIKESESEYESESMEESESEDKDIVTKKQVDKGDRVTKKELDNGEESEYESESVEESEFESESEEEDIVIVTKKQVDNGDLVTKKELDTGEESESEYESESEEESEFESESEEEDIVTKKQVDNGDCESVPSSEEEKADVITYVAKEQLVKHNCDDKTSLEISGVQDSPSKEQMIFLDNGIDLPITVHLIGNNKSGANTKMIDNVLIGKENSHEYSSVAKEDNQQNKESDPTAWSMRQLKKELKKLSLNSKKANSDKLEEFGTVPRAALQTLPENNQF